MPTLDLRVPDIDIWASPNRITQVSFVFPSAEELATYNFTFFCEGAELPLTVVDAVVTANFTPAVMDSFEYYGTWVLVDAAIGDFIRGTTYKSTEGQTRTPQGENVATQTSVIEVTPLVGTGPPGPPGPPGTGGDGGGGGLSSITTQDTATVDLTGDGALATPLKADVKLSSISAGHLSFDVATQVELNAEATQRAADDNLRQLTSAKGVANGYASLDGSGRVPSNQLPSIAISEFLGVVANQAAMLALTGERGDWCTRSDLNQTFILIGEPASTLGNWQAVATPTDAVTSVDGRTGAVSLSDRYDATGAATTAQAFAIQRTNHTGTQPASTISDFAAASQVVLDVHQNDAVDAHDASAVSFVPTGTVSATNVQAAVAEVDSDVVAHLGDTVDAHDASAVSFAPTGQITATDVQAALVALDTRTTNGAAFIDRLKTGVTLYDDFLGTLNPVPPGSTGLGNLGWNIPAGQTGVSQFNANTITPGMISCSATTTGQWANLNLGDRMLEAPRPFTMEIRFRTSTAQINDGANDQSFYVGLHTDLVGAEPANGIYWEYSPSSPYPTHLCAVTANASTRTKRDTGYTMEAAVFHRFRITCDGINYRWYIDDALVAGPDATNAPSGSAVRFSPNLTVVKVNGAITRGCQLDYFALWWEYAR